MIQKPAFCDGRSRRNFIRVGAASALGVNVGLPQILRADAANPGKSDVSLIWVFLQGGLSTMDTLDLKEEAPIEIRGPFKSISTNVPGTRIGEDLPLLSKHMDKFSMIRSFTHSDAGHGSADHYMLTGYHIAPGFNGNLRPNNQRPAHGSVISQLLGANGSVPPNICVPSMHPSCGPAFLGAAHSPFVINADPNAPNFSVPDLLPPMTVDSSRLENRQQLLSQVDRFQGRAEAYANKRAESVGVFREKAFDLMTSPEAKKAFDIGQEPEKLRDEYGRNTLGQSCLMARRLVESGVRCVTINDTGWDTHSANFNVLRNEHLPRLDMAMTTLFRDLHDRGALENTMVVVSGEFGRTPKINKDAGRDHWSKCFTVAIGGGGIQGGRVIGKSDRWAAEPAENPFGPEDLALTMHKQFGIDGRGELHAPDGRPFAIVSGGRIISELL